MTPEDFAGKAKADALANKATPEAADAAYNTALAEAKTVMGHSLYAGLQGVNREISARVKPLEQQLEEAKPFIEAGKKKIDGEKDAGNRHRNRKRELPLREE